MALFLDGLLEGRGIVTVGVPSGVERTLVELGARVEQLVPEPGFGEDEERVGEWARQRVPLNALVYAAGSAEDSDAAWVVVREVGVGALIPADGPGKVVLVAPRPGSAEAEGLRAGLENLARTLSIEWARYQVTVVAVAPGTGTDEATLGQLVAFLCSPGGEYLSGCKLELGAADG
jgi:hypothetical protein